MPFSPTTRARLMQPLDKSRVHFIGEDQGRPDRNKPFLEGCDVIDMMNEIFGFDGWTSSVKASEIVKAELFGGDNKKQWRVIATATVRVETLDGNAHEDVGCHVAIQGEGHGAPIKLALLAATTNALKRACRQWGNAFGNSLYDDEDRLGMARFDRMSVWQTTQAAAESGRGGAPPTVTTGQPIAGAPAPTTAPTTAAPSSPAPAPPETAPETAPPSAPQDRWGQNDRASCIGRINDLAGQIANGPRGTGRAPQAMTAAGIANPAAVDTPDRTDDQIRDLGRALDRELTAHQAAAGGQ